MSDMIGEIPYNSIGNASALVVGQESELYSKPIRKKHHDDDEYDEDNQYDLTQNTVDISESVVDLIVIEGKARSELLTFLLNKNVDLKAADEYKIHLKRIKSKKGRESSSGLGYSVTYSSPDGSILISKTDVLNDIMHNLSKKAKNGSAVYDDISRKEYYDVSRERLEKYISTKQLPQKISDIKLIDIGHVDKRLPFHNSVQIYPVGYKCEQLVSTNSVARGVRDTLLWCEIVDVDGDPEFLITVKSTGQTHLAATEEEVWKKFDPTNVDKNWNPSFFNLDIELLIEGLEGSIDCTQYKYHAERGYGVSYFHNDQAVAAKKTYFLKTGRERRNKSRQKLAGDPIDDIIDESLKKHPGDTKDRTVREKEEALKRKAAIRESIKEEKDLQRKQELANKEKQKIEEKEMKERLRNEDKARTQIRKDMRIEIKRSHADASQLLLEYFDMEEDVIEQMSRKSSKMNDVGDNDTNFTSNGDLSDIINSSLDLILNTEGLDIDLSSILEVSNFLYVFRNFLKLHIDPDLDNFASKLLAISAYSDDTSNISVEDKVVLSNKEGNESSMDKPAKDDEEAVMVDDEPTPTKKIIAPLNNIKSDSELLFDRIQLCMTYALREPLLDILDVNEALNVDPSSRREKQAFPITLPLNQLTWMEIARMSLLRFIYSELGKSKEDIQGAIRGGKHTNLKATSKSIIKYIRYKMAKRVLGKHQAENKMITDDDNGASHHDNAMVDEDYFLTRFLTYDSGISKVSIMDSQLSNAFNTEDEIIQTLSSLSPTEYSESYLRCAKVFLKVFGTAQAKNLVWEVDRETYFDYYQTMKNPMAFVNVATSLLNKSYGDDIQSSPMIDPRVCNSFYRDMRQVMLNCATFNTETTYLFIQAQKLLHVLFRHMQRWVWNPSCTSYQSCDEQHCVWSFETIPSNFKSIKCDRCLAIYSLDFLFQDDPSKLSSEDQHIFAEAFLPSQNQIDQSHEEWFCPFCLCEDSIDIPWKMFSINEWGTSATIPWLFNEKYSTIPSYISTESSYLLPAYDALQILSNPSYHSINGVADNCVWSPRQRTTVLNGLCHALRADTRGVDYLQRMASECEKLLRISSKANFREADFMKIVKEVIGDEGVSLCRSFLDGMDSREKDLQNRVIEGRCVICKGSTYEDDIGPDIEVILCDGCDAEVHLHCLNLEHVPSSEWHCPSCTERLALRESKAEFSIGNIEEYRSKGLEEELLTTSVIRKSVKLEEVEKTEAGEKVETTSNIIDEGFCLYCGMGELDMCSPFVIGQTREEHDVYVKGFQPAQANGVLSGQKNTSVTFQIDGFVEGPPKVEVPYFPLLLDEAGKLLCSEIRQFGKEPVIVHELCALHMFQARLDRSRHTLRRRRKMIGDQVIAMAGFNTIALGYDSYGRSYWKFPVSDDLFICMKKPVVLEKREFNQRFGKASSSYIDNEMDDMNGDSQSKADWKRISDTNTIRNIISLLTKDASSQSLRQNIINYVLTKRELKVIPSSDNHISITTLQHHDNNVNGSSEKHDGSGDDNDNDDENDEEASEEEQPEASNKVDIRRESSRSNQALDAIPCALKLLKDKGFEVLPVYEIAEEAVFEDVNVIQEDDEDDGVSHREYFSYSRNKYFAIAIINHQDKKLKYPKGSVTVTYQIHREGLSYSLAYTPLNEQWNDNIYYFSTVTFKRSGNYTISFIVEGADFAAKIEPLVFPVAVRALYTLRGPKHALDQLHGIKYITSSGRQIVARRRELNVIVSQYEDCIIENEFIATKHALMILYASLPLGSLAWDHSNEYNVGGEQVKLFESVANASGWNDYLDSIWREAVESAENPMMLMECLLILEFFINKAWLAAPYNRLINSLALPHFAVKSVTTSAVALRIYCLDKAMMYEKVINLPRTTRRGAVDDAPSSSSSSKASKHNQESEVMVDPVTGRSRRQASVDASSKIQSQTNWSSSDQKAKSSSKRRVSIDEDVDDDNDEDNDDEDNDADDNKDDDDNDNNFSRKSKWRCTGCKAINESRARSCDQCGERKLPGSLLASSSKHASSLSLDEDNLSIEKYSAPKSWKCHYCKSDNEPRARSCGECGERKTVLVEKQASSSSSSRRLQKTSSSSSSSSARSLRPAAKKRYIDDEEEEEFDEEVNYKQKPSKRKSQPVDDQEDNNDDEEAGYFAEMVDTEFPIIDFDHEIANKDDVNMKKFLSILNDLYEDERSVDFWMPVNTKQVPMYRQVIANPMDLGTICKYVLSDFYAGDENLFAKDVRLVWENCKTFNMDTSVLYERADELSDIFESLLNQHFQV